MSDYAKKLAFGSMLGVANHFATIIIALFLMPFVVYSLGDRIYGFWTLASAFIGYYGLLDLGLSSAIGRFIAGAIGAGDIGSGFASRTTSTMEQVTWRSLWTTSVNTAMLSPSAWRAWFAEEIGVSRTVSHALPATATPITRSSMTNRCPSPKV